MVVAVVFHAAPVILCRLICVIMRTAKFTIHKFSLSLFTYHMQHSKNVSVIGSIRRGYVVKRKTNFPVVRSVSVLEEAMGPAVAKKNITLSVEQVFRLLATVPLSEKRRRDDK